MKLIFTLLSFSFCFSMMACQGDEGTPVNYGPAVSQTAVDNALNAPLAKVDPLKIQLGQFTDVIQSQIISGQAYQSTGEVGTSVVGRDDQATQVVFTILEKTVSYSDNKVIARELTRIAQKATAPTTASILTSRWVPDVFSQDRNDPFVNSMILFLNKYIHVSADTPTPTPLVTFHNLTVQASSAQPPKSVQSQPNCGGVTNCSISITKVSFDMLVWNDPKAPDKIHREFSLSPDVPFFSNVMSQCDSLLVPVGVLKTLVTLCSDVTNFRFTTP